MSAPREIPCAGGCGRVLAVYDDDPAGDPSLCYFCEEEMLELLAEDDKQKQEGKS